MGGPMSAAATSIDLEHSTRRLHSDFKFRKACKLVVANASGGILSMRQTLQGILHVDDCLLGSRVLCQSCILEGLKRAWPNDIGLKVEGIGPSLQVLGCVVSSDGRPDIPPMSSLMCF